MALNSSPIPDLERGPTLRALRGFGRVLGRLSRGSGPILVVTWYGFIFALSSQSSIGRPGPITGSWVLNTGHSLLFGLLALWMLVALPRDNAWPIVRRRSVALVMGMVLLLGALDEIHQGSVPGRTESATDVITDLTGAACVVWICAYTGSAAARERGARWRLMLSLAACFAAGALATIADNYFS